MFIFSWTEQKAENSQCRQNEIRVQWFYLIQPFLLRLTNFIKHFFYYFRSAWSIVYHAMKRIKRTATKSVEYIETREITLKNKITWLSSIESKFIHYFLVFRVYQSSYWLLLAWIAWGTLFILMIMIILVYQLALLESVWKLGLV